MTDAPDRIEPPPPGLVVLAATGATGRLVVSQALAQGYRVTARARHPETLGTSHPRLRLAACDVLDPLRDLTPLVAGSEAVLSTVASRERRPSTVSSAGVRCRATARAGQGLRRLLCLFSAGVAVPQGVPWRQGVVMDQIIQRLDRHPHADMVRRETVLRNSRLGWTVIRAPRLTDGPPGAGTRVSLADPILGGQSLRRSELARFMLAAVTWTASVGRLAHLASPRRPGS
ncbi:MAG TPA: NAD(P)H-binding protein [Verrucomicrobiae bacterium]|nr:NAD(P)H-binding protein [Verrucomicrobiae bacterium]